MTGPAPPPGPSPRPRPTEVDDYLAAIARGQTRVARTLATRLGSRAEAEDVIQSALLRALDRALEAVHPADARLLRQVELGGKPLRQVSRALGIRTNTAAVRLHRARRAVIRVWRDICRFCRLHWRLDCDCRQGGGASRGRPAASRRV